jgi:hypothetical protein
MPVLLETVRVEGDKSEATKCENDFFRWRYRRFVESAPSGFAGLVRARVAHLSLVAQSPQIRDFLLPGVESVCFASLHYSIHHFPHNHISRSCI